LACRRDGASNGQDAEDDSARQQFAGARLLVVDDSVTHRKVRRKHAKASSSDSPKRLRPIPQTKPEKCHLPKPSQS
jgi:hypothetical protein